MKGHAFIKNQPERLADEPVIQCCATISLVPKAFIKPIERGEHQAFHHTRTIRYRVFVELTVLLGRSELQVAFALQPDFGIEVTLELWDDKKQIGWPYAVNFSRCRCPAAMFPEIILDP